MNPRENDAPDVLTGWPTTPEEDFYVSWGRELVKGSLKAVNEANQRVLTLAAAMLGGSAFVKPEMIDVGPRLTAGTCFFLALVASLAVTIPWKEVVCPDSPDQVRRAVENGMHWKKRALAASGLCLAVGLIVGFLGVTFKEQPAAPRVPDAVAIMDPRP